MDEPTIISPDDAEAARALSLSPERERVPEVPGYTLEALLGQGAFGEVWRGVRHEPQQRVAVKLLRSQDAETLSAMAREVARLQAVAEHPHVVTMLDARISHRPPYLVTPLLKESLQNAVQRGRVPVRQAATWLREIAEALHYVHAKGILHCDLKPANILVDDEDHVRVVDFGQAAQVGESGLRLGTMWYMPPEQADLRKVGVPEVAWDVYALGATMYHLLSGQPPRLSDASRQSLSEATDVWRSLELYRQLILGSPLIPLRELNPFVDADLACIVEHCLQLDPTRRYSSAGQLLEDLRRRKRREPLLCRPRHPLDVAWRFLQRTPLAGVLLLVLAGAFANIVASRNEALSHLGLEQYQRALERAHRDPVGAALLLATAVEQRPQRATHAAATLALRSLPRLDFSLATAASAYEDFYGGLCFSSNGDRLLTFTADNVQLWDAHRGVALTPPIRDDVHIGDAAFSSDGTRIIAVEAADRIRIWDAASGQPLTRTPPGRDIDALPKFGDLPPSDTDAAPLDRLPRGVLLRNGRVLGIWHDAQTVAIRDAVSGDPVTPPVSQPGHVTAMVANADGSSFLTAADDQTVHVWSPRGWRLAIRTPGLIVGLAWSPDETLVATALADNAVRIWNLSSGAAVTTPLPCGPGLWDVTFSPDGHTLAASIGSSFGEPNPYSEYLWDVRTGQQVSGPLAYPAALPRIAFSPDSRRILTASMGGGARLWDIATGKLAAAPLQDFLGDDGAAQEVAFSPDGAQAACFCANGRVSVYTLPVDSPGWRPAGVDQMLDASRDGRRAVTRQGDTLQLWDVATGQRCGPALRCGDLKHAALSPDGRLLVTGESDGIARLYRDGQPVAELHLGQPVLYVTFDPTGRSVLTLSDGVMQVWDATRATAQTPLLKGHLGQLRGAAFSADGKTVLALSSDLLQGETCVETWDAQTGKQRLSAVRLQGDVAQAVLSPDGTRILVPVYQHPVSMVKVLDGRSGAVLCQTVATHDVLQEVVCGTTQFVTASADRVRVWRLADAVAVTPDLTPESHVYGCTLSADETLLAILTGKGLQFWDAALGNALAAPVRVQLKGLPRGPAWSPDGQFVIVQDEGGVYRIAPDVDPDAPWQLLRAQAEAWTGARLDAAGAAIPLSPDELREAQQTCERLTRQHAAVCKVSQ